MDDDPDFYAVLGIDQSASKKDIRAAYHRLARTCHPDKGGDRGGFERIQRAYDVLGDDQRRSEYDDAFSERPGESLGCTTITVSISALYRSSRHTVRYQRNDRARSGDIEVPAGTMDYARLRGPDEQIIIVRHMAMRGIAVRGRDVMIRTVISLRTALCEGAFQCRRPDGLNLNVSVGEAVISPGSVWCLAGHGLPCEDGDGNLFVQVDVVFPTRLKAQTKLEIEAALPASTVTESPCTSCTATPADVSQMSALGPRDQASFADAVEQCPVQ